MKGELHIPDLPEVPVALKPVTGPPGGVERRVRAHWLQRIRDSLMGYLPLLLMVTLALGTWLVAKNSPGLMLPSAPDTVAHEPDYTLDHFTLQRFDATGALKVEIEGSHMQHFVDDDTMEVEQIRVISLDEDGRRMTASALHGRAKGDASVVWLDGRAQVVSEMPGQLPVQVNGEHLRAQPKIKRVDSESPVIVQQGGSEFHADGMEYEHTTRILTLHGTAHALMLPPAKGVKFGDRPPSSPASGGGRAKR